MARPKVCRPFLRVLMASGLATGKSQGSGQSPCPFNCRVCGEAAKRWSLELQSLQYLNVHQRRNKPKQPFEGGNLLAIFLANVEVFLLEDHNTHTHTKPKIHLMQLLGVVSSASTTQHLKWTQCQWLHPIFPRAGMGSSILELLWVRHQKGPVSWLCARFHRWPKSLKEWNRIKPKINTELPWYLTHSLGTTISIKISRIFVRLFDIYKVIDEIWKCDVEIMSNNVHSWDLNDTLPLSRRRSRGQLVGVGQLQGKAMEWCQTVRSSFGVVASTWLGV